MSISIRLMSAALVACAAQLCGCSNFACCYTELSPEEFQKKATTQCMATSSYMFESNQPPIEYRGSDERFAYFDFNQSLLFPKLFKTPKRDFDTPQFRFGRFPKVDGVYYKPPFRNRLPKPGEHGAGAITTPIDLNLDQHLQPGRLLLLNEDALRLTDD